jgi:plastocyanin domain-containing protein
MTTMDWLVIAGGLASIAWINWYFFIAGRSAAAATAASGGVPEIEITVEGGYSPALITARAGAPVRLVFNRIDRSGCSEEVVLPDFGIRKYLPTGEKTAIEVTPPSPGRYEFMCGMSMLRGVLVATEKES